MSRGKSEFKTMEFSESGVCKNARQDNIETKDVGDVFNEAFSEFVIEVKRAKTFKRVIDEAVDMAQDTNMSEKLSKKLGVTFRNPLDPKNVPSKPVVTPKPKKPMNPKMKKALIGTGLLGTGATGAWVASGGASRKLRKG